MENKFNELFNSKETEQERNERIDKQNKLIKLCINVPKEYYLSLERFKLDIKEVSNKFIPIGGIIETCISRGVSISHSGNKLLRMMKIFNDKYYKVHAEQNIATRISVGLYTEMEKVRLDGRLQGYRYSINFIVNFCIFYFLVNEPTKFNVKDFLMEYRLRQASIKKYNTISHLKK